MPTLSDNKKLFVGTLITVLILATLQILFLPVISERNGIAWDGRLYARVALDIFQKVDDYHLFRLLPSWLVFGVIRILHLENNAHTVVVLFQLLNLLCISASVYYCYLIAKLFKYDVKKSLILFASLIFNFLAIKLPFYTPVMTDMPAYLLSIMMCYYYFSNNNKGIIITGMLTFFTWPSGYIFGILFLLFPFEKRDILSKEQYIIDNSIMNKAKFLTLVGVIFILLVAMSRFIVIALGFNPTPYPMELGNNIAVFFYLFTTFISIALLAWFYFKPLLLNNDFYSRSTFINFPYLFKKINYRYIIFFIFLLLVKIILTRINNFPTELTRMGYSITSFSFVMTTKPFIGIIDHLSVYGPAIILCIFSWNKIAAYISRQSPVLTLFFLLGFLFFIKTEARTSISWIPFLIIIYLNVTDSTKITSSQMSIFLVLTFLFSKIWYPIHLASFQTYAHDLKIYLKFPAQYYFMFTYLISWSSYFILATVTIIAFIIMYKTFYKKEPSA